METIDFDKMLDEALWITGPEHMLNETKKLKDGDTVYMSGKVFAIFNDDGINKTGEVFPNEMVFVIIDGVNKEGRFYVVPAKAVFTVPEEWA